MAAPRRRQLRSGLFIGLLAACACDFLLGVFLPVNFAVTSRPGTPAARKQGAAVAGVGEPAVFVQGSHQGNGHPAARGLSIANVGLGLEVAAAAGFLRKVVLGLGVLYGIMSVNEYLFHRYIQHLGINHLWWYQRIRALFNLAPYRVPGHVEHHRETYDDMTLAVQMGKVPVLDEDPFRGTAFPWMATVKMTSFIMVQAYPAMWFLGWSGVAIVPVVLTAMLLHATIWNCLHPPMHGLPDVPFSHGAPGKLLAGFRNSPFFNWLRSHHEGHHRAVAAHGNYNVCCPLVDVLVGTYVGRIPPKAELAAVGAGKAAAA